MSVLFLRCPSQSNASYSTVLYGERLAVPRAFATLAEALATITTDTPVVVITPITHEVVFEVVASAKQRKEAGANLAVLVEDQLADDYENLHWLSSELDAQHALLRGISRSYLTGLLSTLASHGVKPALVLPESALLPEVGERWLWYPISEQEVYLRFDEHEAAVVLQADAALVLSTMQQKAGRSVTLHCPQLAKLPELPAEISVSSGTWSQWADLLRAQSAAQWLKSKDTWLVGEFAHQTVSAWSPRWRLAVAASAAALLISYGYMALSNQMMQKRTLELHDQSAQMYQRFFPAERRVAQIEQRFAQKLAKQNDLAGTQILQAMAQTSPSPEWQVVSVDYRFDNVTKIDVKGGALTDLDVWAQRLAAMSLTVQVDKARLDNGIAMATLNFSRSGGKR